ncbi:MAG: SUF system NifU family Fe-S cluster assembly protein [Candidatus Acidiferrales bacterium]
MSELRDVRDLYQDMILEHSKKPRNFRSLPQANRKAEGYNPLCGDHFTVFLHLENDEVKDISFEGSGCAISKASGSMMTTSLKGKTKSQAQELFARFHRLVTSQATEAHDGVDIGKLVVFSGVSEFPVRVKCATLAWHTMLAALEEKSDTVSTE